MLIQSSYANAPAWLARLLVLAVIALVLLAAASHKTISPARAKPNDYHDTALYRTMVDNVAKGKGYYSTIEYEHRAHGYPTSPPQVFREPTLAYFLASLRTYTARNAALYLLAAAVMFKFYTALLHSNLSAARRIGFMAAASTGVGFVAARDASYSHEVWAALLLALALLLYRADRWWPSIVVAVVACLVRELAFPFLLVMAAWSLFEHKRREFTGWLMGIIAFTAAITLHLRAAAQLYRPGDMTSESWIALGGWPFVLETARFNVLLHGAPLPIIAFAVCCAVIGLAGATDARSQRAAFIVAGYLAALTIIGRPGNYYWGIIYAPMLPIGFVYAPVALRDLYQRTFSSADTRRSSN